MRGNQEAYSRKTKVGHSFGGAFDRDCKYRAQIQGSFECWWQNVELIWEKCSNKTSVPQFVRTKTELLARLVQSRYSKRERLLDRIWSARLCGLQKLASLTLDWRLTSFRLHVMLYGWWMFRQCADNKSNPTDKLTSCDFSRSFSV